MVNDAKIDSSALETQVLIPLGEFFFFWSILILVGRILKILVNVERNKIENGKY